MATPVAKAVLTAGAAILSAVSSFRQADATEDLAALEAQREAARKVAGVETDIQESPYGTGTLKEDIQETYQAIDYSQRQAQQAMADRDAAAYEEALSAGGLVKKPIRKRTRKKKGKGLAQSK